MVLVLDTVVFFRTFQYLLIAHLNEICIHSFIWKEIIALLGIGAKYFIPTDL